MPSPAQKKKQYVKTPEYRRAALKYSAFMLIVGVILSCTLAFLIHRAENRPAPPAEQETGQGQAQEQDASKPQQPLQNKK